MAASPDTLHVNVLESRGLLRAAEEQYAASYCVTLAVGFWKKSTPFASASGGAAVWQHSLQIPKDSANDVLKVALVEKRPGSDATAEVAHAMVELREMGPLLAQPGATVEDWVALTIRESGEAFGAVKFALRFQHAEASGPVPNRAASVDSSLPAGWRPTPYDRLSGSWHAGGVADGAAEVEEEFVLKVSQEQLADGSWSSSCTGGNVPGGEEDFAMVELSLEGAAPNQKITFIQRYPDGAETHWAAILSADHGSMHSGTWNGACNGTFTCKLAVDHAAAAVPQPDPLVQPTPPSLPAVVGPTTPRSPPVPKQTMTPPAPAPAPAPAPMSPQPPARPPAAAVAAAVAAGPEEAQQTLEQQADRFEELSQALDRAMQEKAAQAAYEAASEQRQPSPEQRQPQPDPRPEPSEAALSSNPAQLRRQRQAEAQRRHAERLGSPSRPRRGTSPAPPNRRARAGSPAAKTRPAFGGSGQRPGTSPRRPMSRSGSPAASRPPFGRANSPAQRGPGGRASSARKMARSNSPAPLPRVATLGGPGQGRPRAITSPDRSRAHSASGRYRSQSPAAPRGFGSSSKRIPIARDDLDGVGPSLPHGDLESGATRLTSPERLGSPSRGRAPDFYKGDPLVGCTVLARFPRDNTWKEAVVQKPVKGGRKYMVDFKKQRVVEVVDRTAIVEMAPGQLRRQQERLGSPQRGAAGPPSPGDVDDPLLSVLEAELHKAASARPGAASRPQSASRTGRAQSASRFPSQQRASRLNSPDRSARRGTPDRRNARLGSPDRRNVSGRLGSPDRRGAGANSSRGQPPAAAAGMGGAAAAAAAAYEEIDDWEATHEHLDDSQVQRFVVEGFCTLEGGPKLSPAFHARIVRQCEALRLHEAPSPLLTNNLLNVLPELLHVYGSKPVACALESLLGRNYILHPRQESHATIPGTECEVWHRNSFGGRYGRRQHRLRRVCAVYFPQKTTVELGSLDVAAGSQYCTLRSHSVVATLSREMGDDTPDASLIDWLAVEGFPEAWGTSRQLVLPAGAVVLMHADLWQRVAANVSAQQRRFCVSAHFLRTEEPVAPSWRHLSPAWTVGARPAGVPALKPLWWSMWSWLCGGIAPAVLKALGDSQDSAPGDVQTLSASLHWSTTQALVPPARTLPPSSYSARPGEEAAALSMALASAHSTAVQAKLEKAQVEAARAERQISSLKRAADEATVASQVIGAGGEAGGASTKAGTLLHEIGVVKMDLALKTRELDELGHKTTKEQQKASVAKDEASKLRKDLRKTEGDIAKVRSKCDGLQQTHLQLQSRLMTVATAARQNKPWDSAWDAWLPAGSGGSFSPRFREKRNGAGAQDASPSTAAEPEQEPLEVFPSAYSPSANVLQIGDSPRGGGGGNESSFGLTSWGGEHEAGVGGGWGNDGDDDGGIAGFGARGGGGGMHVGDDEALSPALRTGNRELELELRVQEVVEARVVALREKLRGVALSAFARSRQFRLLRCIFSEWIGWVGYRVHREGVQRRAIEVMKKSTRMKVWRAWMGWAAAKQMEERFDEIKQQVEDAGGGGGRMGDDDEHGSPHSESASAAAMDGAEDPYLEAEQTGRPLEGSLLRLSESARAPARGSHRIDTSAVGSEVAALRAAYTLAAEHGVEGAQVLLQRALGSSVSLEQQQQQPEACGDLTGRSATFGLVALPPKLAAAVQPKLAAVLRSAKDPEAREVSAWVLGEWATMPGACSTEVLAALTVALVGDGSRSGAAGAAHLHLHSHSHPYVAGCWLLPAVLAARVVADFPTRPCMFRLLIRLVLCSFGWFVAGAGDAIPAVRAAAAEALGNLGAALAMRARLDGGEGGGASRGLLIQLERVTSCLQLALTPAASGAPPPHVHAHAHARVHARVHAYPRLQQLPASQSLKVGAQTHNATQGRRGRTATAPSLWR
jgi:hypothetical protein